jgi:hypothetical protein
MRTSISPWGIRPTPLIPQLFNQSFDVPFTPRTRNTVLRLGAWTHTEGLTTLSIGDLAAARGMGPRSLVEFCSLAEMVADLAEHLPVAVVDLDVFRAMLQEPFARDISGRDPRFADLLPAGHESLYTRGHRLLSITEYTGSGVPTELARLCQALPAIRQRVASLASEPLEMTLRHIVRGVSGHEGQRLAALERP